MTSNLIWEPVNRKVKYLSDNLKFILRDEYGYPVDRHFDESDIPFLRGLLVGGDIKCARVLIEAIQKHGKIEVREEW